MMANDQILPDKSAAHAYRLIRLSVTNTKEISEPCPGNGDNGGTQGRSRRLETIENLPKYLYISKKSQHYL